MQSNNKKKICIVASSFGKGGAEKSAALQSIMLSDAGFDVYLVSILDIIEYDYKGELLNLGLLKNKEDSYLGRFKRLLVLKNYIKKHKFHCIIDNRSRVQAYREFIITKYLYKVPTIYVTHNFNKEKAFTKYKWLNKYLYRNEIVITVSNEAEIEFKEAFKLNNIRTIYNTYNDDVIQNLVLEKNKALDSLGDYILYFGRIDEAHKNLKFLLRCYKKSRLAALGYKLILLGNGPDLKELISEVKLLALEKQVLFEPFKANPFAYVKQAYFTVLTSHYEGFPMSLIESLSVGTPVIAINCKSGPKEIISNEKNGLLVEGYKEEDFTEAMNRFVLDKTLYNQCKLNTKKSIEAFKMKSIMKDWITLINTL